MGFGLGAPIYGLIVHSLPAFAAAAKAAALFVAARTAAEASQITFNAAQYALKPDLVAGLMNIFTMSGIAFIAFGCIFAFALREPPARSQSTASRPTTTSSRTPPPRCSAVRSSICCG